jgi:transcription initiation factor TFIID subunit 9B
MAHELNSQPLPALPESFDIIRLPPPHQRITDVNFDLLPDQSLDFDSIRRREDDDEESESSEDDEDEVHTDDGGQGVNGDGDAAEDDADGEDEEMEEVGVDPVEPVTQNREMDEDYDV